MTSPTTNNAHYFAFPTFQGKPARAVFPARSFVPAGAVLIAEFDSNGAFKTSLVAGTVTYSDGQFTLDLTATEVNTIKDGFFRITRLSGSAKTFITYGKISFVESKIPDAPPPVVIDGDGTALSPVAVTGDYNDLSNKPDFATPGVVDTKVAVTMQSHKADPQPHVYDDLPSFTLLFENGLI